MAGPYTLTFSYIGYKSVSSTGYQINQADMLVIDGILNSTDHDLNEVVITGKGLTCRLDRLGAPLGITAGNIARLLINNRSFTSLLALSPLSNGGSIGGQLPSSTNYLIDGASARNNFTSGALGNGPFSLSLEAIREFAI